MSDVKVNRHGLSMTQAQALAIGKVGKANNADDSQLEVRRVSGYSPGGGGSTVVVKVWARPKNETWYAGTHVRGPFLMDTAYINEDGTGVRLPYMDKPVILNVGGES